MQAREYRGAGPDKGGGASYSRTGRVVSAITAFLLFPFPFFIIASITHYTETFCYPLGSRAWYGRAWCPVAGEAFCWFGPAEGQGGGRGRGGASLVYFSEHGHSRPGGWFPRPQAQKIYTPISYIKFR